MPTMEDLKIESIVVEGNPRDTFDKKGESFKAFVDNVKQHGIITPITVRQENGGYKLIAGQRRLAGAKAAGLKTIPALVREGSSDAMSVSENIHRDPLTPMQEAKAFKKALETHSLDQIAKAYSVTKDYVSGRVKLLRLPESLQQGVDDGTVPIGASKLLADIAEHSPELSIAIVELMNDSDGYYSVTLAQLVNNTGDIIQRASRGNEKVTAFNTGNRHLGEDAIAGLPSQRRTEIMKIYEECERFNNETLLTEEDVEAARSFGCLLSIVDGYGREDSYVTDPDFLYDRLKPRVVHLAAKAKDKRGAKLAQQPTSQSQMDAQTADEEKRRKDRERAKKGRLAALELNAELGEMLAVKTKRIKPDKDVLAVLGQLIVESYGTQLFLRGMRYTTAEFKHVTPAKREGSLPKVEKIQTQEDAEAAVKALWSKCKTADEMAGFLMHLLTAAMYADQRETTNADRKGQPIPWLTDSGTTLMPRVWKKGPAATALNKISAKLIPNSVKTASRRKS